MKLILEKSKPGRKGVGLPKLDVPRVSAKKAWPKELVRSHQPKLPQLAENDVVRHYTNLSRRNYGVDQGFYPLGSCTMKYNPKINEEIAANCGFGALHPLMPEYLAQGALEVMFRLEKALCEISGFKHATLQPAAGAHGELTGIMLIKAYHRYHGKTNKNVMLVPDSAHGTNPASAVLAGYKIVELPSDDRGNVDIQAFRGALNDDVAGIMLTNPSTLGLLEENITEIANSLHERDALLYYDGANLNAVMGYARPGDMGFDVMHFNLHKTFSTPHGGGGPGSGPVAVNEKLVPFLPVPTVEHRDDHYFLNYDVPMSIGPLMTYYGNFAVMLRALVYILRNGAEGLKRVSEDAVLNANYVMQRLKEVGYTPSFPRRCMHEFVLNNSDKAKKGARTLDISKRLLDFGIHPATMYFPLIVKEAMMIEPTETESRETLDNFIEVMAQINREIDDNLDLLTQAPHNLPVKRLDDVRASREPVFRYKPGQE
ncbi:MAG: aminomethyl-transferring glycine dehydrogenase subunit GcvPB [Planctomycetota bacterium]|nr:aminomethyl-transferring glycine dehydrogenase subunit GcvPB [Planctomycetota bacterium]